MKKQFLFFLTLGMLFSLSAQVPSYVPTNGLIGFYTFNNNAIDNTGNSNPISNTATLTTDRFNNSNSAYYFNGSNIIKYNNSSNPLFKIGNANSSFSINFWVNTSSDGGGHILGAFGWGYKVALLNTNKIEFAYISANINETWRTTTSNTSVIKNKWQMVTLTRTGNSNQIYIDGNLDTTLTNQPNIRVYTNYNCWFGGQGQDNHSYLTGKLDDIGFWDRALDSNEIKKLFKGCTKTETHPSDLSVVTTKNAIFNAKHTDSSYTAIWQSKHVDMPWNNLVSNNTYTLKNKTLTIKNVTVSNHNQKIRVIYKNQNCLDTSTTATLTILDTCINSVYDTIAVQDTLIINAKLTGTTPLKTNLIKVYPNPAKDYLVLDFGNYISMSGYEVIILDATGKSVYSSTVNKQLETIDINTWSGKGIYFIRIFDKQGNRIENKKIIIQ